MTNLNLPKNMQLIDHGNYLEIVRVWRGWGTLFRAGFAVVWWVILSTIFENFRDFGDRWLDYILLLFVASGVFLIYDVIANIFNKTYIFANESKIEIRHRPIPWFGNLKADATDINQLYVKEVVHRGEGGTSKTYELRAKTNSGKDAKILSGLSDADQAKFVEEKLKALLHLENRSIPGEYR